MKRKDLGKGLVILLVVAMLFLITSASLATTSTVPDFDSNFAGEKLDVLVGFHGPPNPGLVRAFGGEIYAEFTLVDVIAARMTKQQARALQKNPSISYIEPDGLVYAIGQIVPWGIYRVFKSETYSFDTWSTSRGGGIGVAVLDTGIDTNHQDLTVVGGRRFYIQGVFLREDDQYNDGHGHGTHVAGTIAALDNGLGVVGVAPDVDLYAVKVLTDSGSGSVSAIVAGIEWTVNHPDGISIINMSLGSSSYSKTFEDACNAAYAKGLLVVSSAGNSGNTDGTGDNVGYPARYESVIAVAASDNTDNRASFSSTGPDVELIAPGRNVYSTVPGGYATYSGTSMASPHVAGVAALVWATDTTLTNAEVRAILQLTAEDLSPDSWHQGYGLVRADLAVAATLVTEPEPPLTTGSIKGRVSDYSTDASIAGAKVVVKGTLLSVTTDSNGSYTLSDVPAGTYDVTASAEGYEALTQPKVVVSGGSTTYVNFGLEATPVATTHNISASAGEGGTISPSGEVAVIVGSNQSFSITANSGYKIEDVKVDGNSVGAVESYTFVNVGADHIIHATFSKVTEAELKVSVTSITYSTSGGKNQDRHLHVTLALKDASVNAVSGASVSIELKKDNSTVLISTGTTGTNGTVTFSFNNAPAGSYTTVVTAVTATGLIWDDVTPENGENKQ